MEEIYAKLIKKGKKTILDVPMGLREAVKELLDKDNVPSNVIPIEVKFNPTEGETPKTPAIEAEVSEVTPEEKAEANPEEKPEEKQETPPEAPKD